MAALETSPIIDGRPFDFIALARRFSPWLGDLATQTRPQSLEALLSLAGRNYMPALFFDWWRYGLMDTQVLRSLLLGAWTRPDMPQDKVPSRVWQEWFQETGFLTDDPSFTFPNEPLLVYRGCLPNHIIRMSWTTSYNLAVLFKNLIEARTEKQAVVVSTLAQPRNILAFINERAECEVVVNTRSLRHKNILRLDSGGEILES